MRKDISLNAGTNQTVLLYTHVVWKSNFLRISLMRIHFSVNWEPSNIVPKRKVGEANRNGPWRIMVHPEGQGWTSLTFVLWVPITTAILQSSRERQTNSKIPYRRIIHQASIMNKIVRKFPSRIPLCHISRFCFIPKCSKVEKNHLELTLQAVDDNLQVQLSHAFDHLTRPVDQWMIRCFRSLKKKIACINIHWWLGDVLKSPPKTYLCWDLFGALSTKGSTFSVPKGTVWFDSSSRL